MAQYRTKTKTVNARELTKADFQQIVTALISRQDIDSLTLSISFSQRFEEDGKTRIQGIGVSEGQFLVLDSGKIEVFNKKEFEEYFELV